MKDLQFLKLCCTELTYKEIGAIMDLNENQILRMVQRLSFQLRVHGRFGLMLYAIKTKLVKPNEIKLKNLPGRLTLHEGLKVAVGGTVLLEEQSELLGEDEDPFRKAYERNVQKRLASY